MSAKRVAVKKMILHHNIDICILLETKRRIYTPSIVYAMWNDPNVKWHSVDSVNNAGGILVIWYEENFKVDNIECSGQWNAIFGSHVKTNFACAIIGVYAGCLVAERRVLWGEISILQVAIAIPLFIVGDFYENLHGDRSSAYLNAVGSKDFHSFISHCNLVEYPLNGHRYTRFRGQSMSHIDKALAALECHLQFPDLALLRYPRGLSDHYQKLLGLHNKIWGWKSFRFLNCWADQP